MSAPRWETHIRPLFNLQDWDHMRARFDLTDVNAVWSFRHAILNRLQSSDPMPPKDEAGPWPQEWIDLFGRWIAAGENEFNGTPPGLQIGQGENYQLASGFNRWRLTGTAKAISPDAKAWLHLTGFSETSQILTLYVEAPPSPTGTPVDVPVLAMVKASPTLQEVIVIGANGATTLPRPVPGA